MNTISRPFISVILPLYNKRNYVTRAVDSILNQSYNRWELIVVDDGSVDGSSDLVPANDKRIRLYRQENRGAAAARNLGVSKATGDYITFIDADDYYHEKKLETDVGCLTKFPKAQWLISAHEKNISGKHEYKGIKTVDGNEISEGASLFENPAKELDLSGWASDGLCFDRHFFSDLLHGFNEDLKCLEISELVLRCALLPRPVVVNPEATITVVDVPGSTFKNMEDKQGSRLKMIDLVSGLMQSHPEYKKMLLTLLIKNIRLCAAFFINSGDKVAARKLLIEHLPLNSYPSFWRLWVRSLLPV